MNLLGLVPFGATPTGNLSVTGAMALVSVFVAFLQAYTFTMLTAVFIGLIRHGH